MNTSETEGAQPQQAAKPLRDAVGSGLVSLDPAAGEQLIKALTAQMDLADGWLERIEHLATPPPLGANTVAYAMSGKFRRLAGSDPNSFEAVLTAYREVLDQTHDVVSRSIQALAHTDRARGEKFARVHG